MEQIKSVGYEDGIIVIEDELDLTYDVVLPVLIESTQSGLAATSF